LGRKEYSLKAVDEAHPLSLFSFFLEDLSIFYINDALSMLGDVPVMSDNDNRVSLSVDLAEKTDDFLTRFV